MVEKFACHQLGGGMISLSWDLNFGFLALASPSAILVSACYEDESRVLGSSSETKL
jgi:hypothetical protein